MTELSGIRVQRVQGHAVGSESNFCAVCPIQNEAPAILGYVHTGQIRAGCYSAAISRGLETRPGLVLSPWERSHRPGDAAIGGIKDAK